MKITIYPTSQSKVEAVTPEASLPYILATQCIIDCCKFALKLIEGLIPASVPALAI